MISQQLIIMPVKNGGWPDPPRSYYSENPPKNLAPFNGSRLGRVDGTGDWLDYTMQD